MLRCSAAAAARAAPAMVQAPRVVSYTTQAGRPLTPHRYTRLHANTTPPKHPPSHAHTEEKSTHFIRGERAPQRHSPPHDKDARLPVKEFIDGDTPRCVILLPPLCRIERAPSSPSAYIAGGKASQRPPDPVICRYRKRRANYRLKRNRLVFPTLSRLALHTHTTSRLITSCCSL